MKSSQDLINPRRACTARVTVVVCLSVILSVMRELTSPVIDHVKNKLTYPVVDGGQKLCGVFSETAHFLYFIFVIFPTFHFGFDHSGSKPFR